MFCKNCGNELCDEAYVCTKCGRLVNENFSIENGGLNRNTANQIVSKKETLLKVFMIVAFSFLMLALMCSILSVACMDINVSGSKYYYITSYINGGWWAFAFIDALIALGLGITAFILGLKHR